MVSFFASDILPGTDDCDLEIVLTFVSSREHNNPIMQVLSGKLNAIWRMEYHQLIYSSVWNITMLEEQPKSVYPFHQYSNLILRFSCNDNAIHNCHNADKKCLYTLHTLYSDYRLMFHDHW